MSSLRPAEGASPSVPPAGQAPAGPAISQPAAAPAAGGYSIQARLLAGAAVVLLAFLAGAGIAVQKAHADSVRSAHFARLQGTVYLLLAATELDPQGRLAMPADFAEPRLSLPGSGLYAGIRNTRLDEQWRSPSALGLAPPFTRDLAPGEWRYGTVEGPGGPYLAASYAVTWSVGPRPTPLVLSVLEQRATFDRELRVFVRTLWLWLGGAALLLLAAQLLLLRWGLSPLRSIAREVGRIEQGEQERLEGRYPTELAGLTGNLNTLIAQERVRQARYKEALSYLAHSLKTPLAVLRNALAEPAQLAGHVQEQVARMDAIVQHQLARAAAGGAARFAPAVPLQPVLERIRGALLKVYADKGLAIEVDCPPELAWRIDEGDVFETMGNLMDNAAKWARTRVQVRAARAGGSLLLQVEDDGPGFSDTEAVLGLHVRGDERVPGHGVGLAVVKDIVASHGGGLHLERIGGEGGGARVRIVLPRP